jgi:hypothetical protein
MYFVSVNGDPGKIRTSDLRFRKPSLYPPELQGHSDSSLQRLRSWIPCSPPEVREETGQSDATFWAISSQFSSAPG